MSMSQPVSVHALTASLTMGAEQFSASKQRSYEPRHLHSVTTSFALSKHVDMVLPQVASPEAVHLWDASSSTLNGKHCTVAHTGL